MQIKDSSILEVCIWVPQIKNSSMLGNLYLGALLQTKDPIILDICIWQ